jgi:hypothetical protein
MRKIILTLFGCTALLAPAQTTVDVKKRTDDKEWKPRLVRTLADLGDLRSVSRPALDQWGGRADITLRATGFFRVEQIKGRWTLVDPEGHPYLSVGVCTVRPLASAEADAALAERFGNTEGWAKATHQQLRNAAFNTLGCWSDPTAFARLNPPLAYTLSLSVGASFASKVGRTTKGGRAKFLNDVLPVFHPDWPKYCDELIAQRAGPLKDDPRVLGYFSDNELPFNPKTLESHLGLPAGDSGRLAAEQWMRVRRLEAERITAADRQAFLEFYAEAYLRPIAEALHRHAPNHLYLGARYHWTSLRQEGLFKASGRYVDVISINWYNVWDPAQMGDDKYSPALWHEWSGRPCVITEWYAKGEDSGLANTTGAGWLVKTQAARGTYYQTFTLGLLAEPACVGWHWFMYQDNDPTSASAGSSNVDSNKGLVDNRYRPWPELLQAATAINSDVYRLRDRLCPAK